MKLCAKNDFYIFLSILAMAFRPQICSPQICFSCSALFPQILEVSKAFLFRENHGTDGRTVCNTHATLYWGPHNKQEKLQNSLKGHTKTNRFESWIETLYLKAYLMPVSILLVCIKQTRCELGIVTVDTTMSWRYPPGCDAASCDYEAHWRLDEDTDMINFTINARQPANRWTAIAFAPLPRMVIK